MIGLLGKKVGMTQIFDESGRQVPVTVLEVGPCSILQIKTKQSDGYEALQLAFDDKKESLCIKPESGHFKKYLSKPKRFVREIRTSDLEGLESGKELQVNNFSVGDYVDVRGTSIGRGFQGVVKRYRHKGGEKAHGSMFGREPGSIGQSAFPSRVFKGVKLPGQMGNKASTIQSLKIEKIDLNNHLMTVRGSVPGARNSYIIVRDALKAGRRRKWRKPEDGLEEIKIEKKVETPSKAKKADVKKTAPKKKGKT
jgi:large subunit ribosomal protein L3